MAKNKRFKERSDLTEYHLGRLDLREERCIG
jgi:hypothetical protein